jgi:hypothetical protein
MHYLLYCRVLTSTFVQTWSTNVSKKTKNHQNTFRSRFIFVKSTVLGFLPTDAVWEYLTLVGVDGRELCLRQTKLEIDSLEKEISSFKTGELSSLGIGKGELLTFDDGKLKKVDAEKAMNYGGELQLQQCGASVWKGNLTGYGLLCLT